jgi:hypothetical protein
MVHLFGVTGEIVDPQMLKVMELTATNLSIRDIGEELGMSRPRVQRLQAKGNARRWRSTMKCPKCPKPSEVGFGTVALSPVWNIFFVQNIITTIA